MQALAAIWWQHSKLCSIHTHTHIYRALQSWRTSRSQELGKKEVPWDKVEAQPCPQEVLPFYEGANWAMLKGSSPSPRLSTYIPPYAHPPSGSHGSQSPKPGWNPRCNLEIALAKLGLVGNSMAAAFIVWLALLCASFSTQARPLLGYLALLYLMSRAGWPWHIPMQGFICWQEQQCCCAWCAKASGGTLPTRAAQRLQRWDWPKAMDAKQPMLYQCLWVF